MNTKSKHVFINQGLEHLLNIASMPAGHNTFFLIKKYSKTQDWVVRLNCFQDFYNQTNSLRSNKSDYLRNLLTILHSLTTKVVFLAEIENVFVSSDGIICHQMEDSEKGKTLNASDFDAIETKSVLMINGQRDVRQIALDKDKSLGYLGLLQVPCLSGIEDKGLCPAGIEARAKCWRRQRLA